MFAIINSGFVIFNPFLKTFPYFQGVFFRKLCPCVWLIFKRALNSTAGYDRAHALFMTVHFSKIITLSKPKLALLP